MKLAASTLLIVFGLSCCSFAQDRAEVRKAIDADYQDHLWELFDHWHRNPELSLVEHKTAARLAEELDVTELAERV